MGDFFNNRYFWFTKFLLVLSGQWPFNINMFAILWKVTVLWSIFLEDELISQMKFFYFTKRPFSKNFVILTWIINVHVELVPFVYGYFYSKEVKQLLIEVKDYWQSVDEKCCVKILKQTAAYGRRIVFIHILNLSCRTLIIDGNRLIYDFLDNKEESLVSRLTITLFKALHATRQCMAKIALDLLYSYVVIHTCCRLELLGHQAGQAMSNSRLKKNSNKVDEKQIISMFKKSFKDRIKAKNYFKLAESTFAMWILITLINCLQLLTHLITTAFVTKTYGNIRINISCLRECIECVLNMKVGQKLIDTSYQINDKICKIKWYEFSKKVKFLYFMMIVSTSYPFKFTVIKILTASIQLVHTIAKMAFSYYTFCRDLGLETEKKHIR